MPANKFGLTVAGSKYEEAALMGAYFAVGGRRELLYLEEDGRSLKVKDIIGEKNTEKFTKKFFEYYKPKVNKWQNWAKNGEIKKFTEKEKEEIKLFYTFLAVGGLFMGYKEASSLLLNYLYGPENKETKPFIISPEIYQNSVIVKDAQEIMKNFILKDLEDNGLIDKKDLSSKEVLKPVKGRDTNKKGNITKEGNLICEKANDRLQKANNIFPLEVKIKQLDKNTVELEWVVKDDYFFRPYEKEKNFYTEFNFGNYTFKLDDGLGQFLVELGLAKEFKYKASWKEKWRIRK
ncbi:MAG: hypothetical protein WHS77_08960 [Brevinematales bacterium]